jgi:nitrilase
MPTVAVVQTGSILGDTTATVEKLRRLCIECARRGARMAVFPEAFIGGYPKGLSFGASVGIRTDAGRKLFRAYADQAISVPGPVTEAISAIAESTPWPVLCTVKKPSWLPMSTSPS